MEFILFIIGLVIGSFLNVVIYRLPRNESIAYPPSHCPHCRHKLSWYDLFPVLSYLLLRGKCRYCKQPISISYPLIELLTGILFVIMYTFAQFHLLYTFYLCIMACIFLVLFFTDLRNGILPFQVVGIGVITALLYHIFFLQPQFIIGHFISAMGAFLVFLLLYILTKGRGMGFGDVVLVFLIGLFLGFPGTVFALYLAFLTGAVISLILILLGTKKLHHDTIPFGPFLVTGTVIALFFSQYFIILLRQYLPI